MWVLGLNLGPLQEHVFLTTGPALQIRQFFLKKFHSLIHPFVHSFVVVYTYATVHKWRSEGKLKESVYFFMGRTLEVRLLQSIVAQLKCSDLSHHKAEWPKLVILFHSTDMQKHLPCLRPLLGNRIHPAIKNAVTRLVILYINRYQSKICW